MSLCEKTPLTGPAPFNPLDKNILASSVMQALLSSKPVPLGDTGAFLGAGIYAIYYTGDFELYRPVAAKNKDGMFRWPIYVGKAVPRGSRKGSSAGMDCCTSLCDRLADHAESICLASNLRLEDFQSRFLVVEDIWISLAERLMIQSLCPLWNRVLDGFGNHDPGRGRYGGMRPRWDVLHPGRPWATRCRERQEPMEAIIEAVEASIGLSP